jgi:hypothetical protein
MLSIEFSEADKQALLYERFHHPHPRVQVKMEALWLKSQGMEHQAITQLVGISANTGYQLKTGQLVGWAF